MEAVTIVLQVLGALVMVVGILVVLCVIGFISVSVCALFYPYVSKLANKWIAWIRGRFEL